MNRWFATGGAVNAKRWSVATVALFATVILFAITAQLAAAKGGGQVGESFGAPGVGNGQFFNPAMLGVDSQNGTIYTGDYTGVLSAETTNFRIQQLSPSGEFKASAEVKRFPETGKNVGLQGIAVDHELGRIYVIESCRVATTGGTFACRSIAGGKYAARKILVYSTTPEGEKLKALSSIALPEGEKEIYEPRSIAVDPSNHDLVILGEENSKHKIIQRVSSAGVLGARFTDTGELLKPSVGGGAANSLAVSPTGVVYTLTGTSAPGSQFLRAWQLPANLSSIEQVPGFAAEAEKENWVLGHESRVEFVYGGPQLAISTDGSTLYWKDFHSNSTPTEAGELLVHGYSLTKGETTAIWGGGSSRCKITTSASPLATTSGGNLVVFDTGAETAKPTDTPLYGLKMMTFGSSGTGCVEPLAKFTVNGKKEGEEVSVNPGETVTFSAASSELVGGARSELIWKFGDGSEKVVVPAKEGEEAPATVTHVYSSAAKVTVKLEIKLQTPTYGNPAPVERTFNVGSVVSGFKLKVTKSGSGTGTVTSSPAGINCGSGSGCEAEFEAGKVVTLSGVSDAGSKAVVWTGCGEVTGANECKVTMSAAKSVGAEFTLEQHLLTVTEPGTGTGTVTSSPAGINCGPTCTANFTHGTVVTLVGSAEPGSQAVVWTGCGEVTGANECKVTMSAAKSISAKFDLNAGQALLKVTKTGIGSGPVTSTPAGIDCHSVCEHSFSQGTVVTLKGVSGPNTKPVVWSGCGQIVGANECRVTLNANTEIIAFFNGVLCTGANITGAGSTLQNIAQTQVWKPGFEGTICNSEAHPTIAYQAIGSGAGMTEWNYNGAKGSINTGLSFIGTDDAPSAAQIANIKSKAGSAELAVIPVAQTAISFVANPPAGCTVEAITNGDLTAVMEGRLSNWSKLETAEGTCNSPITRVVRKDASGTTYQLKNYLFALYKKGLFCTTGATEGKQSWAELGSSTSWPQSCGEKTLSSVVEAQGATEEVSKVNATAGSIGYAALPDAKAGVAGTTAILELQDNGQKKGGEAQFADPGPGQHRQLRLDDLHGAENQRPPRRRLVRRLRRQAGDRRRKLPALHADLRPGLPRLPGRGLLRSAGDHRPRLPVRLPGPVSRAGGDRQPLLQLPAELLRRTVRHPRRRSQVG